MTNCSSREVGTVAADTKLAFIDIVRVAAESRVGKALADRVAALNQQKLNELNEKQKVLQAAQQKLESAATVLNTSAVAQLQRDIDCQQIDIRRFTEDAEAELESLQAELENEFEAKLSPIVQKVAIEHGLHLLFRMSDSGLVWADPSLDRSSEVIQELDATPAP